MKSLSFVVVSAIPLSVAELGAQTTGMLIQYCPGNDIDTQNRVAGDVMTRRNERPQKTMIAGKKYHHNTCE